MQIGVPTQCMTYVQFESGDEHITTKNLMIIAVLYQLLLVIGCPILLGGFKLGDEVLDQWGLGAIFIGHGMDGYFILYDSHNF